ncbi:MAG: CRISPR-associated endoribonuclease Cas6 [Bacteroidota bacterium]
MSHENFIAENNYALAATASSLVRKGATLRLHLTIRPTKKNCSVTLNYSYYLSSAIYKWIETSSPEYSAFLHDEGFQIEGTIKRFKHFCFSQLQVPQRRVSNGRLHILSPTVEWYIAMPVEQSLQHLVVGMFEKREFFIEHEENRFVVEQVETLPDPQWRRLMKFKMLSPLTASVPKDRADGKLGADYLRPDDPRLSEVLRMNMLNKYRSLYCRSDWQSDRKQKVSFIHAQAQQKETFSGAVGQAGQSVLQVDTEFRCTLDQKFIADQERKGKRITRKITIKEGRTDASEIIGLFCPLTLEGNPALIALAYESGLGEKGSLGFGMLEAV